MRKAKIIVGISLTGGLLFSACQKDHVVQPVETPRQLVKYYDTSFPANNHVYKYDGQGRLIEQVGLYAVYKYSYTGNKFGCIFTTQNNAGNFTWSNGTLDNNGRVLEMDGLATPPNGPSVSHKYTFTYNAEGYLVKMTHKNLATNNLSEDNYTWSNGNLITNFNNNNGQPNYRVEYKYYDNLANHISLDIFQTLFGNITDGVTGKRSKNLLKQASVYTSQNVLTSDELYEYKLDSRGYPVYYSGKSLLNNYEWTSGFEYNK